MARGRRGGGGRGGGRGGGADDGALSSFADMLKDVNPLVSSLAKGLESLVEKAADFGKNMVANSAEVVRAKAAYEDLASKTALSNLEGLASSVSPRLGSLVGGARGLLGQVSAAGNAAQDLEDLAARSAFQGIPLDKDFEKEIFPMLRGRRESVEEARQQAADVTGEALTKQGKGTLEALGLSDLPHAIASEIGTVLREWLGGGGRH